MRPRSSAIFDYDFFDSCASSLSSSLMSADNFSLCHFLVSGNQYIKSTCCHIFTSASSRKHHESNACVAASSLYCLGKKGAWSHGPTCSVPKNIKPTKKEFLSRILNISEETKVKVWNYCCQGHESKEAFCSPRLLLSSLLQEKPPCSDLFRSVRRPFGRFGVL